MKVSIVVSLSATRFQALALREDLKKNIFLLKELGFNGVELAVRNPAEIEFNSLKEMLFHTGLQVPAIGTGQAFVEEGLSLTDPDPDVRRQARERLVLHLELSVKLNALVIIGLIRGTPKRTEKEQALRILTEELGWLCEKAENIGSPGLVIEPLNRYETTIINTLAEAMDLIKIVGKKNIGILADSFHMNIEEKNISDGILKAGHLIRHIHLADSNRFPPGQGHLDFDEIFRTLKKINYQSWISGEYLPEPDPENSVRLFAEFLKAKNIMS